jgi:sialic acid synthase SpsE
MLIIAEIGQNHNGDMNIAKKLIHIAKKNGADIVKFQLYDVDKIFSRDFEWYKESKSAQLTKKQVFDIAEECKKVGIEFMASVFDLERFNWTEELGMKRYKIASRSIHEKELIEAIASTGKDIIISLGMWNDKNFPVINTIGNVDFLYCVAKYPTRSGDLDFLNVDFQKYSGFSDHTIGITASLVAMSRGAKIIEKHFTLHKTMHGPDHSGSMDIKELQQLVQYSKMIQNILYHKQGDIPCIKKNLISQIR